MANWNGMILTDKGRNLQAKVEAGATLTLTKMKLGDGVLPPGQSLETLTDLVSPKKILGITTIKPLDNGLCQVTANISNADLEQGFNVRECGLFANDPDDGEILYAITIDPNPDYLPPNGTATAVSETFSIYIAISNGTEITIIVDPSGMVTEEQVETMIEEHNTDPDAHQNLNIGSVPIGATIEWRGTLENIPYGFLNCDSSFVGKLTYPQLYTAIGTTYGESEDGTQFRLPDDRAMFKRGLDMGRGIDIGRELGSQQEDAQQKISGITGIEAHSTITLSGPFYKTQEAMPGPTFGANSTQPRIGFDSSLDTNVRTALENRPVNVSVIYIIKAFDAPVNQGDIDLQQIAQEMAHKVNYSDFTQDFSENGWSKLPNGLIMQWCKVGDGTITSVDIILDGVFPIAFPNACLNIVASINSTSGAAAWSAYCSIVDNSNFKIALDGTSGSIIKSVFVMAVGY